MEEVRPREVTHDTANMFKHIESSVHTAGQDFGTGSLGVGIDEHSINVALKLAVFLVRRDLICKFVLSTLVPKAGMPLRMMSVAILWAIVQYYY
jgi:hypothetical protein